MCGIVGYVGHKPCKMFIFDGLQKLEYRGYDSAGIAVAKDEQVFLTKSEGKLANLKPLLNDLPDDAVRGIGHTRWATHGSPTTPNAHPHASGKFSIVHNGIIENYEALKEQLLGEGIEFKSETDTEVVLHLIAREWDKHDEPLSALTSVVRQLVGAFSLGVMVADDPKTLYLVKEGSPLVIGLGDGENMFASDALALAGHSTRAIFMNDGEMARVTPEAVDLYNFEGEPSEPMIKQLNLPVEATGKQGFRHYMLKEIHEQPRVIRELSRKLFDTHKQTFDDDMLGLGKIDLGRVEMIKIVACGTAYYSGLVGRYLLEPLTRLPVDVELASEFRYRNPYINDKCLVIAVSQSGETADTLACLKLARKREAQVLAICNVDMSSIVRESHGFLNLSCGPEIGVASTKAFTAMVLAQCLLAHRLGQKLGHVDQAAVKQLAKSLGDLSAGADAAIDTASHIENLAKKYYEEKDFIFIGRGFNYPLALEGALKLKEISYIHAEGYAAGELKHGPIALVDRHMPVVAVAPRDGQYEKTISNIEEVRSREGRIIGVGAPDDERLKRLCEDYIPVPQVAHEGLQAILSVVPLQLLSYYVAVWRGTDVDQPRNLAKSVTVE